MTWRYLVFAEPSGNYLGEIDLTEVETTRVLSGPQRLTARVVPGQDLSILNPWQVSIWAEDESGRIRGGGFLPPVDITEQGVRIDCIGYAGYPTGMPWTDEPRTSINGDPLGIVRRIWDHLLAQPGGNIGVTLDQTTTPVRVGTRDEPFVLTWWETYDLGKVIDDLAEQTPFDYLEHHEWDGDRIAHHIQLGYPTIGVRRRDLAFEIGVNITENPALDADEGDYATEIHALGAGEGAAMVRAPITRARDGVRRVVVLTDKTAQSKSALAARARRELGWRDGAPEISQLTVTDHTHAPLGSFDVGDHIHITGHNGTLDVDRWVRIVEISENPGDPTVSLTVAEENT